MTITVEYSYSVTRQIEVEVPDGTASNTDLGKLAREAANQAVPPDATLGPSVSFWWSE